LGDGLKVGKEEFTTEGTEDTEKSGSVGAAAGGN
jgi:hypothetical protein